MVDPAKIQEFVFNDDRNWFRAKYHDIMGTAGSRYWTFKAALNLMLQRGGTQILETGCQRLPNDWGAGCSSEVFGDFLTKYGGHLTSIDLSRENCDFCVKLLKDKGCEKLHTVICNDSVSALNKMAQTDTKIDLCLLDSFDYPYGELLDKFGGKEDLNVAIKNLAEVPLDELLFKYGHIVKASQLHCLAEVQAASPMFHDKSVLLIDDVLPGGGKPRLAKQWLIQNGWECVLEDYGSLWIRS